MPEPDLLTLFVARFEELGATYLVTGSVAATLYGEPRATHDIDLVVELSAAHCDALPRIFPTEEFYLPPPEVVRLENQGYQFEAAEASFDLLVKRCAGTFTPHFERLKYHVEVGALRDAEVVTEATVKLIVAGDTRHEVAEGDGPVNALDAALRKALNGTYPNLRKMHLVDYKVRAVNSEAGTAARIRVIIESKDDQAVWGTVGVSENIIEASWMALVDAIEYKLYKDETQAGPAQQDAKVASSP